MLILHAGYIKGQIYFWGETALDESKKLPEKTTEGESSTEPAQLPYGADGDVLKSAIAETLFDSAIRKLEVVPLVIWIPTARKKPISSSPLITEQPKASKNIKLAAWKVDTVCLGKENTISFLSACVNKDILKSGIILGSDLVFWTRAIRFAGAIVARQVYLPNLKKIDGDYRAVWEPIFLADDAKYLEQLAKGMPSTSRALTDNFKSRKVGHSSPGQILSDFIVETVDYIARHAIYNQPQTSLIKSAQESSGGFLSVHDVWLQALVEMDPKMDHSPKELVQMQQHIGEWRRPLSASTDSQFKLFLKLEEPGDKKAGQDPSQENWYVHFYLQSNYQREVLFSADQVWQPSKEEAAVLNHDDFDAKEFFLSSLGRASTICPRIEKSLKTDAPEGYKLDTGGAYEFLTERAIALRQAGFGVGLPDWWRPSGTRKRLSTRANVASPKAKEGASFSLQDILDFQWEITMDGETVSKTEIEELVKSKMPLVHMRGHWIQVKEDDLKSAMDLQSSKSQAQGSLREIVQMALGSVRIPGNFDFDGVKATGWVSEFIEQLEGEQSFDELPAPAAFVGTLRSYQLRGFSWLSFLKKWGLGACLADDMGLGKTIQALCLIEDEWHKKNRRPVLVICPTSLTGNWHKEAERFTPDLPVMVHHGINRSKGDEFRKEAEKHALVISSYSLLHRDIEILKKIPWAGVILDEAQNIKNPKTKQARSAKLLGSEYRIAMTGTPIENNVGDLWSIMEFLNPGFLGSQADFKRRFMQPIQANHESDAVNKLKQLTGPFILRRLKNDKTIIKDLPSKMEMKVYCTLTKEQASLYETLIGDVEAALDTAEGIQRRGLVLATLTKLKQICNHPTQFAGDDSPLVNRSGKLSRLTEMLEEIIAIGDRTLVFTQFAEMGKLIQKHLQETFGQEVLFLYGSVPKKKRDEMIERFQNDVDGPKIFVLSLKAGGTGLNLMRANHVFHYDRWWNPAVEDQATDRVYRIGQTKNVQIHKFLCAGTLEEKIDDMIEHKKGIASKIVGAGESWLTELSTNELKRLFELKEDAIAD